MKTKTVYVTYKPTVIKFVPHDVYLDSIEKSIKKQNPGIEIDEIYTEPDKK